MNNNNNWWTIGSNHVPHSGDASLTQTNFVFWISSSSASICLLHVDLALFLSLAAFLRRLTVHCPVCALLSYLPLLFSSAKFTPFLLLLFFRAANLYGLYWFRVVRSGIMPSTIAIATTNAYKQTERGASACNNDEMLCAAKCDTFLWSLCISFVALWVVFAARHSPITFQTVCVWRAFPFRLSIAIKKILVHLRQCA